MEEGIELEDFFGLWWIPILGAVAAIIFSVVTVVTTPERPIAYSTSAILGVGKNADTTFYVGIARALDKDISSAVDGGALWLWKEGEKVEEMNLLINKLGLVYTTVKEDNKDLTPIFILKKPEITEVKSPTTDKFTLFGKPIVGGVMISIGLALALHMLSYKFRFLNRLKLGG